MKNFLTTIIFALALSMFSQIAQAGSICAILFEHENFAGAEYIVNNGENADVDYVGDGWNDRISSAVVMPNCKIALFEHANHEGSSLTLWGNHSYVGNRWNDRISSFTCTCE